MKQSREEAKVTSSEHVGEQSQEIVWRGGEWEWQMTCVVTSVTSHRWGDSWTRPTCTGTFVWGGKVKGTCTEELFIDTPFGLSSFLFTIPWNCLQFNFLVFKNFTPEAISSKSLLREYQLMTNVELFKARTKVALKGIYLK